MTVRLEHPDLPGQPITVDERAVPHYAASGWVEAPEPGPVAAPKATTTDTEPEPAPNKPSRRRPTKEGEQ